MYDLDNVDNSERPLKRILISFNNHYQLLNFKRSRDVFVPSSVPMFLRSPSFSSPAFMLTVHINTIVHRREEHATWINTIPLKIATLLNLQSLKWAYSFRTDVLIVSATSRHYSVLKRQTFLSCFDG